MVIVHINLGMGNQMFQYAFARSLAAGGTKVFIDHSGTSRTSFSYSWKDDVRNYQLDQFKITIPEATGNELAGFKYIRKETTGDRCIFRLASKGLWPHRYYLDLVNGFHEEYLGIKHGYVEGWFQDRKYFEKIKDVIIKEFQPVEIDHCALEIEKRIREEQSIGIHVRRGDYVRSGVALNSAYYKLAVSEASKRFDRPSFFIFSDDLGWAKRNLSELDDPVFVNEDRTMNEANEIRLMSLCKSLIISNSTFSWWGAWLNQCESKKIYAPKLWYPNQKDIVPDDWIVIR